MTLQIGVSAVSSLVTREDRDRYAEIWGAAVALGRSAALRSALVVAIRSIERPTLRDLLALIHEWGFDLESCPEAGDITIGELLGRGENKCTVNALLESLGLGAEDPLSDAETLGVDLGRLLADGLEAAAA